MLMHHMKQINVLCDIFLITVTIWYRTMQTAVGVFGGESYTDGVNIPPLMVENTGHSGRPAISSLNCPPFIAVERCREHLVSLVLQLLFVKGLKINLHQYSYCLQFFQDLTVHNICDTKCSHIYIFMFHPCVCVFFNQFLKTLLLY